MTQFSRRKFIQTSGAASVGLAGSVALKGCSLFPANNNAPTNSFGLETTAARLGVLPTLDAAPIVIAKEKGFFAKYGMTEVQVVKQSSWGVMADNTELGSLNGGVDGGQYQMPIPYLLTEGMITRDTVKVPMVSLLQLATHANGIAIAQKHAEKLLDLNATEAKAYVLEMKQAGTLLNLAYAFPQCNQELWLRYWLAAAGINPDVDVKLSALPTAQTVSNMKTATIDGFCAGDPWVSRVAGADQIGFVAALTSQIWQYHPQEYFSMRADWVTKNPKATKAILKALMEAQQWLDQLGNRQEAATILAKRPYVNLKRDLLVSPLENRYVMGDGREDINDQKLGPIFWKGEKGSVSYPYKSHELWFLTENIRWGFLSANTNTQKMVDAVNREALWREAAQELEIPEADIPTSPSRGVETFFDGVQFDPANPQAYLKSLKIKNLKTSAT
jgi:bicarbonate transport system substrate-binding protein